jgi:type I restriction enzyme S subunit
VAIIRGADFPTVQNQSKEKVPLRYVSASKLKTRALKPGDLIIEISGGTKDRPTGRCVHVTENMLNWFDEPVVAASFCRLIRPKSSLSNYLALHMDHIYRQGKTWMYQNVSTGLSNFQMKEFLAKETLPVPPSDMLDAFNRIIDPITAKRTTSETQTLTALRDTLLPKLMRGEVRVKAEAVKA